MNNSNSNTTVFNDDSDSSSSENWLAEYLSSFAFQSACYLVFKHFVEPLVIYFAKLIKLGWKSLMNLFFPENDAEVEVDRQNP